MSELREQASRASGGHRPQGESSLPTAAALALGPAVGLGLARFGYGLILPSMRSALHWDYAVAGTLNTANAAGYLAGALCTVTLRRRYADGSLFVVGLLATVAGLAASAVSGSFLIASLFRLLSGVSAAVSLVAGAALLAHTSTTAGRGRAAMLLGVYFGGGGLGVAVSGLAVPTVLARTSAVHGWRLAWLTCAAIAAVMSLVAVPAARSLRASDTSPTRASTDRSRWPARAIAPTLTAYGLYGAGYIAYMTFIVAYLQQQGADSREVTAFWLLLGLAAVAGGFVWSPVLAAVPAGAGVALVLLPCLAGSVIPLFFASAPARMLSAVCFGTSFLSVITAATACARRVLGVRYLSHAVSGLTIAMAGGQCVGPILTGLLSDRGGGIRMGLYLSAGVVGVAMVAGLVQDLLPGEPDAE